jgi:hypothetical protein
VAQRRQIQVLWIQAVQIQNYCAQAYCPSRPALSLSSAG